MTRRATSSGLRVRASTGLASPQVPPRPPRRRTVDDCNRTERKYQQPVVGTRSLASPPGRSVQKHPETSLTSKEVDIISCAVGLQTAGCCIQLIARRVDASTERTLRHCSCCLAPTGFKTTEELIRESEELQRRFGASGGSRV